MVVNVVDIAGVAGLESKDHAPVCADGHGMKPLQGTMQCMQTPARCVQVRRLPGAGECRQDQPEFDRMAWLDASARTVREELSQALVPEVPDHCGL